jgi:hypothetical protein
VTTLPFGSHFRVFQRIYMCKLIRSYTAAISNLPFLPENPTTPNMKHDLSVHSASNFHKQQHIWLYSAHGSCHSGMTRHGRCERKISPNHSTQKCIFLCQQQKQVANHLPPKSIRKGISLQCSAIYEGGNCTDFQLHDCINQSHSSTNSACFLPFPPEESE